MPAILVPDLFSSKDEWMLRNYFWIGKMYGAEYEVGKGETVSVLGSSLANCHPGLMNAKLKISNPSVVLDACTDPGAGASTDYVQFGFESNKALLPGEEIFTHYGDTW
jgi:hypothetical protein